MTKGDACYVHTTPLSRWMETRAVYVCLLCLDERICFLSTCASSVSTKGDACCECFSYDPPMRSFHMHLIKLGPASTFIEIHKINRNSQNEHASSDKIQHHHLTSKEASLGWQQYHSHSSLAWQQYHKIHRISYTSLASCYLLCWLATISASRSSGMWNCPKGLIT